MGREIKFRSWDKKRKRMYEVLHLHTEQYPFSDGIWATVRGYDIIEQKDIHLQIQPKDVEVMQYTGLKDKNGVEIYEGDIVAVACDCDPGEYAVCTHPPVITYVGWFQDNASFELRDASGKLSDKEFSDDYQDVYEVIGNIYEHSDLLADTVSE